MACALNLRNVPECSVHKWLKRDNQRSPETYNMASTVEKTNINNVKVNQNGGKNMTVIEQFTKKNFSWKNISFPASLFRFMLFTHCEMYSAIASL